jgi:hypothetical protein
MGLNENQKRRVHSYLMHIEKSMRRMEHLLQTQPTEGILYCVKTDLSAGQRRQLLELFEELCRRIQVVAHRFSVPRSEESLHSAIAAELSQDWTLLEELYSKKLRGLGSVSTDLKATLDPEIERLVALVNRGFDTCRTPRIESSESSRGGKLAESNPRGKRGCPDE